MDTVFWHQCSQRDEADVFIIDGTKRRELGIEEKDKAFSRLLDSRKWPRGKQSLSLLKRIYPESSADIEVYFRGENEAMVQSHFLDRDDAGRLVPYMFYTDDASNLTALLQRDAELAGFELNPDDLKLVRTVRNYYRNRPALTVCGIAIVGLILYLICK